MSQIVLGFLQDLDFIIKIAFIIFLVIFVKQRITKNWLAITLIVIASIVLIFFYWPLIGSVYVIYILITIGIGSLLVDIFFVTMGESHKSRGKKGTPTPKQMLGDEQEIDYEEIAAQRQEAMKMMKRGR